MSKYSEKLLSGEKPSAEDWVEYLKEAHQVAQSMTPHAFKSFKNDKGINSYQLLTNTILSLTEKPRRILDLACGDGHLVTYLQNGLDPKTKIVGVDMSEHELDVARSKKLGSDVIFKCEMVNSISEESESFDAILCHMAFMLMNPVETVVFELHRLLRKGGLFAAVVGGSPSLSGFYLIYQKIVSDFIKETYPNFGAITTGDPKFKSTEGFKNILQATKFADLKIGNFNLTTQVSPNEVWSFFKDMYVITALPEKDKIELKIRISNAAHATETDGRVVLDFPLKLITCYKK